MSGRATVGKGCVLSGCGVGDNMNLSLASLVKGADSRMACVLQRRQDLTFEVPRHLSQVGLLLGSLVHTPPAWGPPAVWPV